MTLSWPQKQTPTAPLELPRTFQWISWTWKFLLHRMCANNISNENPAQPQPEQVQRHGQEVQLCPDRPPSSTPPVGQQQLNVILKKDIIVDLVNGQFDIWCISHLDLTRRASRWPRPPDEVGVEDGAEDLDIMYLKLPWHKHSFASCFLDWSASTWMCSRWSEL